VKREHLPDMAEHKAAWALGMRWCSNCHEWVRAEEWHRQYRCISAIGVCRDCVIASDEQEKRVAPDARIELKAVPIPSRIRSLFDLDDDDE
jgi:hypothetical protein